MRRETPDHVRYLWNQRLRAMRNLRSRGWTYEAIGIVFGLSRERIRQILREENLR
jgi:DNA-directed RNA polymerase sigma subunit (sigma70/sigma32)